MIYIRNVNDLFIENYSKIDFQPLSEFIWLEIGSF